MNNAHEIPDAELKVLRALWDRGTQTMRQLAEAIYQGGGASEYATVQKLLERLLDKGLVMKDTDKWPYVFRAALSSQEVAARMAAATAARVMGITALAALAGPISAVIGGAIAGATMAGLFHHERIAEPKAPQDNQPTTPKTKSAKETIRRRINLPKESK